MTYWFSPLYSTKRLLQKAAPLPVALEMFSAFKRNGDFLETDSLDTLLFVFKTPSPHYFQDLFPPSGVTKFWGSTRVGNRCVVMAPHISTHYFGFPPPLNDIIDSIEVRMGSCVSFSLLK